MADLSVLILGSDDSLRERASRALDLAGLSTLPVRTLETLPEISDIPRTLAILVDDESLLQSAIRLMEDIDGLNETRVLSSIHGDSIFYVGLPKEDERLAKLFTQLYGRHRRLAEMRGLLEKHEATLEELSDSREHYRSFLEQSSEGVWRFEFTEPLPLNETWEEMAEKAFRSGYLAECNEAMARMYGYSDVSELLDKPLREILPAEDPANLEMIKAFHASGYRLTDVETHEFNTKGEPVIFLNNLVGQVEDGVIERVWGTQRDITELRRIESELRLVQERSDLVVNATDIGFWYCDLPFDNLVWNDQVKKHFWLPPATNVTIDLFFAKLHPEDRERTAEAIQRSIDEHSRYDIVYRTVNEEGVTKHIRAIGQAFYREDGTPYRFDGITIDITEENRIAQAIRSNEERLRLALSASHMGEWEWNVGTDVLWFSPRVNEIFGLDPNKPLTFTEFTEIVVEQDREMIQREVAHSVQNGTEYMLEYRVTWPSGDIRWIAAQGLTVFDAAGKAERMIGVVQDVTERKLDEQALIEAKESAEAANRMKDQFLATLSHELRTPLNAILGWTQLLDASAAMGDVRQDELLEGLEVIERNARVQAQLIEDLLDISRIISGKMRLEIEPVDIKHIIEAACGTIEQAAEAKDITVRINVPDGLAPINGDPSRLQQIIWNLLSNAVKFTPKGGEVAVEVASSEASYDIIITDSGEGIEPEFLPYVFDRFRQADGTSTRKKGGLGLGLSIVRQLVEMHGGSAAVDSMGKGHGTTFIISLPLRSNPESPVQPHDPKPSQYYVDRTKGKYSFDGKKILVVDDEPDARELVKRLLTSAKAHVTLASSADEAERLIDHHDIIISDISMPERDGYDLIRSIRAKHPDLPAIALTAYARAEDRERALKEGFQEHLPKPLDPERLRSAIHALIMS
jgi:PAS domain S-box-containing protein